MAAPPNPIILYDGVCGLCNRMNQFVLKRDAGATFRFAALQSSFAREILVRHSADPDHLDTFYIVLDHDTPEERLLAKARAALHVFRTLGGAWRTLTVFAILPTALLDAGYNLVASNRYRLFGRHGECLLPQPEWKSHFIDSG